MSDRLTILLLTDLFPPVRGGLERHVDELATFLCKDGHDVHVATCTRDPQPTDPRVTTYCVDTAASRVLRHAEPSRPFHPPSADPIARRDLRRIIERVTPDVVHGHSWLARSLPPDLLAPLLLTAHDYGLVCQRKTLFDRDHQICSGPRGVGCIPCGSEQYGWLKSALGTVGTQVSRDRLHADHVLAVSDVVARAVRPWLDVPISVMHNWVQGEATSEPRTKAPALPPGDFVMYAGDSGQHKGVDILVEAWTGPGRPQAELFLAMTRGLSRTLPPAVHSGSLQPEEMSQAWAAASVAVVPSLWGEPCPLVALEAMHAGTPIVASQVGGMPELVRDGVDGLLVPPGDPAALRTAVGLLLEDSGLRQRLGMSAYARARDFGPESIIPRLVALYRDLISARSEGRLHRDAAPRTSG